MASKRIHQQRIADYQQKLVECEHARKALGWNLQELNRQYAAGSISSETFNREARRLLKGRTTESWNTYFDQTREACKARILHEEKLLKTRQRQVKKYLILTIITLLTLGVAIFTFNALNFGTGPTGRITTDIGVDNTTLTENTTLENITITTNESEQGLESIFSTQPSFVFPSVDLLDNISIPTEKLVKEKVKTTKDILVERKLDIPIENIENLRIRDPSSEEITFKEKTRFGEIKRMLRIHAPVIDGKPFAQAVPLQVKDSVSSEISLEGTTLEVKFDSPEITQDVLGRAFTQENINSNDTWKMNYHYLLPSNDFIARLRVSSSSRLTLLNPDLGTFRTGMFSLNFAAEKAHNYTIAVNQINDNIAYVFLTKNYTAEGYIANMSMTLDPLLSITANTEMCQENNTFTNIEVLSGGVLLICPKNTTSTGGGGYVNISLGVTGNFTLYSGGTVEGAGRGAPGGAVSSSGCARSGGNVTGLNGTTASCSSNNYGGGGGGSDGASTTDSGGGGGGGLGGRGGMGGKSGGIPTIQGDGANVSNYTGFDDKNLTTILMGGGGGGSSGDATANYAGGNGGAGIKINAGAGGVINIWGIMNVSGQNGTDGDATDDSGGGGGAGGHVILIAKNLNLTGTIKANGARGGLGVGASGGDSCGGGGGGGGRIFYWYGNISTVSTFVNTTAYGQRGNGTDVSCDYQIANSLLNSSQNGTVGTIFLNATVFSADYTLPVVNFTAPTLINNTLSNTNFIFMNATVTELNPAFIIFKVVNASGVVNLTAYHLSDTVANMSLNVTGLAQGNYFYNITLNDSSNQVNWTETRQINLDAILPIVNFTGAVESNNTYKDLSFIFVNVSVTELNPANITFSLSNATASINTTVVSFADIITNTSLNFSHLRPDTYFYNVTITDLISNKNWTDTRQQTLVGCGTSLPISFTLTHNLANETIDRDTNAPGTICSGPGLLLTAANETINCNNFKIEGRSVDQRNSNNYGINVTNQQNITITNCVINQTEYGIVFNQVNDSHINNTFIDYTNKTGIYFIFSAGNNITNTYINANGTNDSMGIFLDTASGSNYIYNATVKSRSQSGLKLVTAIQNNISNSEIRTASSVIPTINISTASTNNFFNLDNITGSIGIQIKNSSDNQFILNNITATDGVILGTSTGSIFNNNLILTSGAIGGITTDTSGGVYNTTINYNNFTNTGTGNTINIKHASNDTVSNNIISSTSTGIGIDTLNITYLIAQNNTIYPTTGIGINLVNISTANISYLTIYKTTSAGGAISLRGLNNANLTNITLLKSTWQINASDYTAAASTKNTFVNVLFNDSLATYFSGINASFYNTSFATENGSIFYWNFSIIDTITNTSGSMSIRNNNITIISPNIPVLNMSTQLTFEAIDLNGLNVTVPNLFRDYTLCASAVCSNQVYTAATKRFTANVTGFTSYTIGEGSTIACTWSNFAVNVTFGNPGGTLTQSATYNASQNYNYSNGPLGNGSAVNGTLYNVTADPTNNVKVNITVRGADFLDTIGGNVLGITNVSWGANRTTANSTGGESLDNMTYPGYPLNYTFDQQHKVAANLTNGSTTWFRFWLKVPAALPAALYIGNYTMQCTNAGEAV